MRILHVTESWGGGTASSLLAMVDATPDLEHHLLAAARSDSAPSAEAAARFATATSLSTNPVAAVVRLNERVRELRPDVVHAHSSVAGTLVRAARSGPAKVAFTPHGFAFDRRDVSSLGRAAFRAVERALVRRTDLVAAVSPHEVAAASALGHTAVAYVPNRATLPTALRASYADRPRVVTIGRVTAAKDWRYLIHLKRYAERQLGLDAMWTWLGGGDEEGERALLAAGVEVTGWLEHDETLARAAAAQLYVHTAAWESAPMSILEAAALGVPLVLRAIPQLRALDLPGLGQDVPELATRLRMLQRSRTDWMRAQADSDELSRRHSREAQGRSLTAAYRGLVGEGPLAPTMTWSA
ncbi:MULTISPECIES: glycosyltransferase [Nocardioides]|uniref:Glycosyltransferase n=1 Tax=Nocardioides vastitatis TaxID=2568655 RepID=A0ABW0ZBV7_9ACTN|nr:glycosyltransferase [Nocardioides sp.]THI98885.1 glycosyltransferase family 4 protein [Nocardioides sp.]